MKSPIRTYVLLFIVTQILLFVNANNSFAIAARKLCKIPVMINEASGLDYNGKSSFWTHNDGGVNVLYKIGSTGLLKQTLAVTGISSGDWEDLTHDVNKRYMFIGSIGNNNHDRRTVNIFRIPYPNSSFGPTVAGSAIKFSYPDQTSFPSKWKNFDAEAFYHYDDHLFIFTKGEGSASAYTKMYSVPDSPGNYVATLVDSFYVNGRITSAALSPDGRTAVLITNTQIHLFGNFSNGKIFDGSYKKISIDGGWTQKEGVTYFTNDVIYLVDEGVPGGNHMYEVSLSAYISQFRLSASPSENVNALSENLFKVYPNPASSFVNIETGDQHENLELVILNSAGQIIRRQIFQNPGQNITLDIETLPTGMYYLRLVGDNRNSLTSLLSVVH